MEEARATILRQRLQTGFLGIIAFAILLFMMVQARFMLISLAIAIILFSLTTDAINAIARQGVARWLATTLAFTLIAALLIGISTSIVAQVNAVVQIAVSYTERAQAALPDLTEWLGVGMQDSLLSAIRGINIAGWMRTMAGQAGDLLSGSILIILFVGFMFAERMFFQTKLERLTGDPVQARQVGKIISTIMHKVNRYLVVKTAVSAVTGFAIWGVFKMAGLDLAMPIAILTFVFNFIPSVGSIVATVIAFLLAFVLSGDIALALIVGAACTGLQFVIGNILDPMLLGQTLRLSSFGIIISLAFWGSLWGIPGMFLAVPIMVALMIICAHIDWLRPLAILLSREGLPEETANDTPPQADADQPRQPT
ncbi:MAG: AI-2E family transporter [Paracoccus sp. (in: a-proteobacteria)]|uniref:AI-2E family transporter n=1 Tax=Paracoccus sp. TaxID=267 RepID=UPI0026E00C83|nr:AI-2E family transporter [Paracoccus sp. (in: a-proteobacteria)]MDO5631560.1 AI-2E family transporter [Paracoccus sp. (in: a-proteobacteria)]